MIRVGPRPTARTIWIGHCVVNRSTGICESSGVLDVRDAPARERSQMGKPQPLARIVFFEPTIARTRIR
jgi:hypothetical protein